MLNPESTTKIDSGKKTSHSNYIAKGIEYNNAFLDPWSGLLLFLRNISCR